MTYEELRASKKEKYVSQYGMSMISGDFQKAYKSLRYIMRYRLVGPEDQMFDSSVFSTLKKNGVDTSIKDNWDYRNDKHNKNDLVPENIVIKEPISVPVEITSMAHWIVRRELQYVGNQLAPDKTVRFVCSRKIYSSTARVAFQDMKDLYKKLSGFDLNASFNLENGCGHMWSIDLESSQQYVIRTLGYMYSTISGGKAKVYILLDNKAMNDQNIDIIDSYNAVEAALRAAYANTEKKKEVVFEPMCDVKYIGAEQRKNLKPAPSPEEYVKIKNKQHEEERAAGNTSYIE